MSFRINNQETTHQLFNESALRATAPPFVPKALARREEESKEEEPILKTDAKPFYPKHRFFPHINPPNPYPSDTYTLSTWWLPSTDTSLVSPPESFTQELEEPPTSHYESASEISEFDEEVINVADDSFEELIFLELEEENRMLLEDLANEIIKTIPAHSFNTQNKDSKECTICLETYNQGDLVKTIDCGHMFHQQCIDTWLISSLKCPLCRHSLVN